MVADKSPYLRGGMVRFSSGERPFNKALRACMIKCLVGERDETVSMNAPGQQIKETVINFVYPAYSIESNFLHYPPKKENYWTCLHPFSVKQAQRFK